MLSSAVIAEAAKQRVASLPTWLIVESGYYLLQFGVSGLPRTCNTGDSPASGCKDGAGRRGQGRIGVTNLTIDGLA